MNPSKTRIGILFGGNSREREVAFAGGRTVYDNLDKDLFEPVPLFVDSFGNLCLLDWQYVYKGSIRDFYPPVACIPASRHGFQIYAESLGDLSREEQLNLLHPLGRPIALEELPGLIDFAFLSLHGRNGEDGRLQGILEYLNIPYSGSGILPAALGMNKAVQREYMQASGFPVPATWLLTRSQWEQTTNKAALLDAAIQKVSLPLVIKSANQGSSIGVNVLKSHDVALFEQYVNTAFFNLSVTPTQWQGLDAQGKWRLVSDLSDFRNGLGFPLQAEAASELTTVFHPDDLYDYFETHLVAHQQKITLHALDTEHEVLLEAFIEGKEFSCIVIEDQQGQPQALPPTQIVKGGTIFDYRSKYLPGLSRKVTPIPVDTVHIEAIREACTRLYQYFRFNVYARIDGFITPNNHIFLNDPNTTSGMMPSSFFFHQAAEIGLNPSSFLTYIIDASLRCRIHSLSDARRTKVLKENLSGRLAQRHQGATSKVKVAVLMGGYSSERHISIESGRNIYEKLASSTKYAPFPVFLTGNDEQHELYVIPVNIMLKDNADDIAEKVRHPADHPALTTIRAAFREITERYGNPITPPTRISYEELSQRADMVFIALHGRPGEDGEVQKHLVACGLPFNGSDIASSKITINKFNTNNLLREQGVLVAKNYLLYQGDFQANPLEAMQAAVDHLGYPIIAKPADDGCSTGVKKIQDLSSLQRYCEAAFRKEAQLDASMMEALNLKPNEEFPQKSYILLEELIQAQGASLFMETTTGLLTHYAPDGSVSYEIFETSESLADSGILSLEEKFLAGEGQNITPARFSKDPTLQQEISTRMRADIEKAARILGIQGYSRIDNFVRVYLEPELRVETIVIEANSLPGMTPATCIFHQCALNGYKPYDFIDQILEFGKARTQQQLNKSTS